MITGTGSAPASGRVERGQPIHSKGVLLPSSITHVVVDAPPMVITETRATPSRKWFRIGLWILLVAVTIALAWAASNRLGLRPVETLVIMAVSVILLWPGSGVLSGRFPRRPA